jgi:hypothetical protein
VIVIGLVARHIIDVSGLGTYVVSGSPLAPVSRWASQNDFDIADLNAAARGHGVLTNADTVDPGPVGGARIDDRPGPVSADQISVVAGGSGIVKDDV